MPKEMYDGTKLFFSYTIEKQAYLPSKLTVLNESSGTSISLIRNRTLIPEMNVVEPGKEDLPRDCEVISVRALDCGTSAMTKIIKIPSLAEYEISIVD